MANMTDGTGLYFLLPVSKSTPESNMADHFIAPFLIRFPVPAGIARQRLTRRL